MARSIRQPRELMHGEVSSSSLTRMLLLFRAADEQALKTIANVRDLRTAVKKKPRSPRAS